MIDFELSERARSMRDMTHAAAEQLMRPISRWCDEHEHEKNWDYLNTMWQVSRGTTMVGGSDEEDKAAKAAAAAAEKKAPSERVLGMCITVEELCWGDVGLYLTIPNSGLGGAAVAAAGTPEQRKRFLARFSQGEDPKWAAMAITEPSCGSDSAAIQTTAVRDGDHWVLNGTKIFCTSGQMAAEKSKGFVVVWATLDRSAGRAGIRAFVVEAGTPGMTVTKVEDKLGIRASDTATIVLEDCRVPLDNILGSAEVHQSKGFKGAMATFDATRPIVAASGVGVARAALDLVKQTLAEQGIEIRYGAPLDKLTALERDVIDMEAQVKAARLLVWRAAWMLDNGIHNNLEASMCKSKAGLVVTKVTQKAVEILGPLGYSRELLVEKWMRDAKITDIYEGTQQINQLIIARRILGYSSEDLR